MRQIEDGLSIDFSRVEVIEKDGDSVILYISGKPYPWNVSYGTALQLVEINTRSSAAVPTP